MPDFARAILGLLASFLVGSIPSALWVGQLARGVDVRQHGSGNLGATNVYRTLGPGLGVTVFLLDALKGFLGVVVGAWIAGSALPGGPAGAGLLGALMAVLGHILTPFAGFKGGKGAATALGAMLAVAPVASALAVVAFFAGGLLTKRISVGSLAGAVVFPILLWFAPFAWKGRTTALVGTAVSLLIILRHLPNLRRILAGTEPVFYLRRPEHEAAPGSKPGDPGASGTRA